MNVNKFPPLSLRNLAPYIANTTSVIIKNSTYIIPHSYITVIPTHPHNDHIILLSASLSIYIAAYTQTKLGPTVVFLLFRSHFSSRLPRGFPTAFPLFRLRPHRSDYASDCCVSTEMSAELPEGKDNIVLGSEM